jgi:hypothetical protein
VEIDGTDMFYEAISRTGTRVDSGHLRRGPSLTWFAPGEEARHAPAHADAQPD